ncbi:hypothetical protein [Streptomyces sp900116325]
MVSDLAEDGSKNAGSGCPAVGVPAVTQPDVYAPGDRAVCPGHHLWLL